TTDLRRGLKKIGSPAGTGEFETTFERAALEADGVPQDLRTGETSLVGSFGKGRGRFFQIDFVEFDPPAVGLHEGTGLLRETRDVSGIEFDIVEDDGPANIGELLGPDDRVTIDFGEHPQPGTGLTA